MLEQEIKHIAKTTESKEFRKFGLTIGIFLLLIGGILFLKGNSNFKVVMLIGGGFCGFALVLPILLRPFFIIWMSFATMLGFIMTRVILSIVYYILFFPIGLVLRLSGKHQSQEDIDKNAESYWILRDKKEYHPSDSEKQF